jgi:hypothetical protein
MLQVCIRQWLPVSTYCVQQVLVRASYLVTQPPSAMSSPSCWFATKAWLARLTGPVRGGAAENQASRWGSYTSKGVEGGTCKKHHHQYETPLGFHNLVGKSHNCLVAL